MIYGLYGYILCIIFSLCSFSGYYAASTYNRYMMLWYLSYQVIQLMFRIFNVIIFIGLVSSSSFRYKVNNEYNISQVDVNNLDYGISYSYEYNIIINSIIYHNICI